MNERNRLNNLSERLARGAVVSGLEAIEKLPPDRAEKMLTDIFTDVGHRLLRLSEIETAKNELYRSHQ